MFPRTQHDDFFGREYACPFGISAIGYAGNFRRDADLLLAESARGGERAVHSVGRRATSRSNRCAYRAEHVWYQLYGAKDRGLTDDMVGRARDCGVGVLVFTVDFPVPPRVEKLMRTGVRPPASVARRAHCPCALGNVETSGMVSRVLPQGGPASFESWARYAKRRRDRGQYRAVLFFADTKHSNLEGS